MSKRLSRYWQISCWMLVLLFAVCGCTTASSELTVAVSPTPNPDEDIAFANLPIPVQKFHRHLDSGQVEYVFVITWYPRPYPDYFNILRLSTDGSVAGYVEIPDWAVQGGSQAELAVDELQRVNTALSNLKKVHALSTGKGRFVIVLNFRIDKQAHIITCTEMECPQEIQDLFVIAERAFQREKPGVVVSSPFKSEGE